MKTIKQFQIFKQGVTEIPVWIVSKVGETFDQQSKINWYTYLGYTISNINN